MVYNVIIKTCVSSTCHDCNNHKSIDLKKEKKERKNKSMKVLIESRYGKICLLWSHDLHTNR